MQQRRSLLQWGVSLSALGALGQLGACGGGGGGGSSGASTAAAPSPAPAPSSTPAPAPAPTPATADNWTQGYVADASGVLHHVSPSGSDSAAGTAAAPWRSIQHAASVVAAGDTVVIDDGLYSENVVLARSGRAGAYITFRAANRGAARLLGPAGSYSAFALLQVAYVRIEGLDIQAAQGHGVDAYGCHHIQVVGNHCHDCGGSGISLEASDYLLAEANICQRNSATNIYQTSGISIYQARATDSAAGFHIIVRRNACWSNLESATGLAQTSEGNGIILDDFHNGQASTGNVAAGNYGAQTLVENNIVANNGGGGIVAYASDNITVRNNTALLNNTDPRNPGTLRGELSSTQCRNTQWANNIAVCSSAVSANANALVDAAFDGLANSGNSWVGNLLFDSAAPQRAALVISGSSNTLMAAQVAAANPLRSDPLLVGGTPITSVAAAALRPGSPARDAALAGLASSVDYNNMPRGSAPDLGALEAL